MPRLLLILTCTLLLHSATQAQTFCYSSSLFVTEPVNGMIIQPQLKKPTFKEVLLKKILDRKIRKAADDDKAKRLVNKLGIISLVASIAAPLILILLWGIGNYAIVQVLFILALALMVTATITGIISLLKRKKLADKKGTHNIPAILGIIFGGGLLLLLILIAATFSFNY